MTAPIEPNRHSDSLGIASPERLPLISFIIRNRNYGRFLGECIASIEGQSYGHFEVVTVDNASTDDSLSIAREAQARDARFRTIALPRNAGPLGAALPALEICSGEFVCFVDADDFLLPTFAASHVQAHLATPRNLAFTTSNVLEINEGGQVLSSGRTVLASRWPQDWRGLRPKERVLVLPGFEDEEYDALSRAFVSFPSDRAGWLWGPGTTNFYRRPIIDLLLPRTDDETLVRLSADGHFSRLGHLLGGSGLIDRPLSAYRIHGSNSLASMVSIGRLRNGHGPDLRDLDIRLEIAATTLLADPERFAGVLTPKQFWTAAAAVLTIPYADEPYWFTRRRRLRTIRPHLPRLQAHFGRAETLRGLLRLLA